MAQVILDGPLTVTPGKAVAKAVANVTDGEFGRIVPPALNEAYSGGAQTISMGSVMFSIAVDPGFAPGTFLVASVAGSPELYMGGASTWAAGILTMTVVATNGSGTYGGPGNPGWVIRPGYLLPVSIHGVPGWGDPAAAFVVSAPVDMGAVFTQEQIQMWTELKRAIQQGLLIATVAGTTPLCHGC